MLPPTDRALLQTGPTCTEKTLPELLEALRAIPRGGYEVAAALTLRLERLSSPDSLFDLFEEFEELLPTSHGSIVKRKVLTHCTHCTH